MKTALLVIDVQNGIITDFQAHAGDQVIARIGNLLSRARAAHAPVIYVQHDGEPGHPLVTGSRGWRIDERIAPLDDDPIIRKRFCNSFHETSLQQTLEQAGISHLIITGCMTEYCVDTACRHATTLGYDVTLVSDGHTTIGNDLLTATQIIEHHNRILQGFQSGPHGIRVQATREINFGP